MININKINSMYQKIIYGAFLLLSIQSNSAFAQCGTGDNISQLLTGNVVTLNTATVQVGQSFTATCSGSIESITLHIVSVGVDGDHQLTFYDGVDPSNPLDSVIYSLTSLESSNDVLITFPVPIPVISGNQYTFMTKFITGEAGFSDIGTDPYLGGGLQFHVIGNPTFETVSPTFAPVDFYFIVHYQDQILPVAVCENITVELDASGYIDFSPSLVGSGSSDDSGVLTYDIDTTYTCNDIGANSVILVVFDPSNNTSSCTAIITVVDLLAPVITCPGNQDTTLVVVSSFTLPDYFTSGDVTIIDNCITPIVNVIQDPVAGTQLSTGVHTVTITTEDESGNSSLCSFDVNVGSLSLTEFDNSTFEFYPNPVAEVVKIKLSNDDNVAYRLYDAQGKLVIQGKLSAEQASIQVRHLTPGIYSLTLINETQNPKTFKLIKQ
ncbi:MAG: hypothetical protein ACJAV5_002206 [Vicingaceae bacterium]|jgi:hypothetical protein